MKQAKVVSIAVFVCVGFLLNISHAGVKATASAVKGAPPVGVAKTLFDFEGDTAGWKIPNWMLVKDDNSGLKVEVSGDKASSGKTSLKVVSRFANGVWNNAYVEYEKKADAGQYLDLSKDRAIVADIYLPAYAPQKMKGKFILGLGEDWAWTEMKDGKELTPGSWTSISADLSSASLDWKVQMTEMLSGDVRKIGVRVESNSTEYEGEIYIDNIRLLPK